MNLYGYGSGDPINNSDPFGLCTPWPDCMFQAAANWGASRGGAVGGAALNLAAAANAASEAFGTNDLGRAVGEGDAAGVGIAAAGFLPIGKLGKAGRAAGAIRTQAANLAEDLTMAEARGGAGVEIMVGKIKDLNRPADKWAKMSHTHKHPGGQQTEIHYWKNRETGATEGYKYSNP